MSTSKDKSQRRKTIYSEEFQEMLDRLEEEDYVDRSGHLGMKKSRLCLEKVKALEKHFEVDSKLQPERKVKISEEIGLEPRQVAVWFQNRRARWKTKQLEREYDHLRASYDALKHDYGSLEQEKVALLNQLEGLKAKIDARNAESSIRTSPPSLHSTNASNDSSSISTVPMEMSTALFSSSGFDNQVHMSSSSSMSTDDFQLCKAYQEQIVRMDELGMFDTNDSCSFFSVDQAPTLHWHHRTD